jgi:hypothetical protein
MYFSRVDGGKVTWEEVERVLRPFGAIEDTWEISKSDMEILRLPEGIWVKYVYWQDCRDAMAVSVVPPKFPSRC